ncbi:hypothetical protein [Lyngbya sp. CCY1209]|uniref:hypothetical protein n=1 Tax=Lyngbya sp. CCY1209 TaxID=2886103 RepID=UPI002D1FD5C5|nr:hypothetical protein [Lyngbya sp. CCY1209]MEB3882550.1 hypothetical protein [Lyngbya sp. CCY1209]
MSKKTDPIPFEKCLHGFGAIVSGCPEIEMAGRMYPVRSTSPTRYRKWQFWGDRRPFYSHLEGRDRGRRRAQRHFTTGEKVFLNWHFQC